MRERLSDRHPCELVTFISMGMKFTAGIGRYSDGRIAEIFLDNHKQGSASDAGSRPGDRLQFCRPAWCRCRVRFRRALCRDSAGRALGPLGEILDRIADPGS